MVTLSWSESVHVLLYCVFTSILSFNLPQYCTRTNQGHRHISWSFYMFNDLMWEFGIVDHHYAHKILVPQVEHEEYTIREHLSLLPVFFIVCPSLIYYWWLPLWYLQTVTIIIWSENNLWDKILLCRLITTRFSVIFI